MTLQNARARRVREVGGRFDARTKHWVLPAVAVASLPEMRFRELADAWAALPARSRAIAEATGIVPPAARPWEGGGK